jgi:glycosyltransferase involved in cell wall biosynthesis
MSTAYNINQPKVTIITTVLNAVKTIEQTILSVINQSYKNIEYIVIDGGSTDGTLDIIERYREQINIFITGPDKGIADGFNKGIALATGEWIGMINADDWYTPKAVELMIQPAAKYSVCCGNLILNGDNGYQQVRRSKVNWLNYGMYIMHPTCFIKRAVYQQVGEYDNTFKIAMDFDMFLRIKRAGYTIKYVNKNIAYMRTAGVSNDVEKMHAEELAVMKRHLGGVSFLLSSLFNYLNKLRWRLWYKDPFRTVKLAGAV